MGSNIRNFPYENEDDNEAEAERRRKMENGIRKTEDACTPSGKGVQYIKLIEVTFECQILVKLSNRRLGKAYISII